MIHASENDSGKKNTRNLLALRVGSIISKPWHSWARLEQPSPTCDFPLSFLEGAIDGAWKSKKVRVLMRWRVIFDFECLEFMGYV